MRDERFQEGQRITWVSVVVNVALTVMQLVVGFIAHSQSLIADAMHTLSDIVADAFVLFANRKGAEAADADHPYGHGRYETAASLVLGLLLAGTGGGILIAATGRLQGIGSAPAVGAAAMWAAMFTLAAKEGLFRYMLATAERLRSPMLVANAWHARADALSSLVVAAGVGGALLGFNFADAVAAIIVGAMIVRAGLKFAWAAIRELIDTGLSADEVAAIRHSIATTPGVLGLHELRTRRMAHQVLVDAHVQVNPRISVSEGHRVAESARQRVLDSHPEVLDVLVHVDAENDLLGNAAIRLPDRAVLLTHLRTLLDADLPEFERTTLHYLGTRVEADIFLPPDFADQAELLALQQRITRALADDPWFGAIRLNQRLAPK
ncbi:MAG: cation diffusion facilitator family transporter [Rhodocyclales bacterium RIFCSPLOWO2_02_FULL_63_24]|nr:MAG: cation diffusion facilitator family transporter [Rhodocyclales bacterium GWA2_65_19]OHC70999.1 MAG: cation diffusion facilitator family transporter [Rhodocyclales bacterium RIFCSPLOWO2_02_FULL_63_24]